MDDKNYRANIIERLEKARLVQSELNNFRESAAWGEISAKLIAKSKLQDFGVGSVDMLIAFTSSSLEARVFGFVHDLFTSHYGQKVLQIEAELKAFDDIEAKQSNDDGINTLYDVGES